MPVADGFRCRADDLRQHGIEILACLGLGHESRCLMKVPQECLLTFNMNSGLLLQGGIKFR